MAFNIEGYNTNDAAKSQQQNATETEELIELDVFEKKVPKDPVPEKNEDLEKLKEQNAQMRKELNEYEQLQEKLGKIKDKQQSEINLEKQPTNTENVNKRIQEELDKQEEITKRSMDNFDSKSTSYYGKNQQNYSEAKETASDFVESTLDVFEGLGESIQQFSGAASKLKQTAHAAWSLKQDREIKRKFKNAPKVNVGPYTFKVLTEEKELMLYSYQGPDTILKLPSAVKNMPITAINPDFLLFRAPKALLNSIKGDTIGTDLDALKQCISCVAQLRLPEHLIYLPSGVFSDCSTLDAVVIPRDVRGVSVMFLDGSTVKQIVFEGKCPSGLKHANIPTFTKIICRKEFLPTFSGIPNLSVI